MENKTFNLLTKFEVKASTSPPHDPNSVDTGDSEVIKIAGYANFAGAVEEGAPMVDLSGDVIVPSGIDVSVWKKNPQILWQHDRHCTIGRGISVVKKKDGLYIEAEIHKGAMEDEDFYRIKSGLISYFSVGFRTMAGEFKKVGDRQVYFITKCLLLEVSAVGIPCCSDASFQIIKSLPDDGGFYAGELTGKICPTIENEIQEQKGVAMKFVSTLRDTLPEAEVKRLEALGMGAKLEEEIEVDAKAYIGEIVSRATAEFTDAMKALQEEIAKLQDQLKEVPVEEPAEATEEEKEAPAEETEEKEAPAEDELSEEEVTTIKGLLEQLAEIKKALD